LGHWDIGTRDMQQPGQHRLEAVAAVARRVLVAAAQAFHAARVRTVLARVR